MGKSSVQPSEPSSVPHQAATSGEEYAVSTKAVPRQRQQQQPQEYAMVDKSKKASASQGVSYVQNQIHTLVLLHLLLHSEKLTFLTHFIHCVNQAQETLTGLEISSKL